MKIRAFWNVAPCSLAGIDRRFRGAYRPDDGGSQHLKRRSAPTGLHGTTSQKALIPNNELIRLSRHPIERKHWNKPEGGVLRTRTVGHMHLPLI
jgi:hypothetical protein